MTSYVGDKKIAAALLVFAILVLPLVGHAAGLVPCGGAGESACTFCHLYILVKNVINWLVLISFPLAAIGLVWAGLRFMSPREGDRTDAKTAIGRIILGIVIVLIAWLIVNTIMRVLVDPTALPLPWNEFPTC